MATEEAGRLDPTAPHAGAPQAQGPIRRSRKPAQIDPDAILLPLPKSPRKNKGKEKAWVITSLAATPASMRPASITATGVAADILFTPRHFPATWPIAVETPVAGPSLQPRPDTICNDWATEPQPVLDPPLSPSPAPLGIDQNFPEPLVSLDEDAEIVYDESDIDPFLLQTDSDQPSQSDSGSESSQAAQVPQVPHA